MTPAQKALEALEKIEAALEPFVSGWEIATNHPDVVSRLSLGQLGALAIHEIGGSHFQRAKAAFSLLPTIRAALSAEPVGDEPKTQRPPNCRLQLRAEGKPYGKSTCQICGSILKTRCPYGPLDELTGKKEG